MQDLLTKIHRMLTVTSSFGATGITSGTTCSFSMLLTTDARLLACKWAKTTGRNLESTLPTLVRTADAIILTADYGNGSDLTTVTENQ